MLLARSLNYRSVADLTENMGADELCLWAAEFERSPWDETRADLRAGIVASTIATYAGKSRNETAPPSSPQDFMPYSQPPAEEHSDSAEDISAFIQSCH